MILRIKLFITGRKAVLRGGIDADICSVERYQPFPIRFYTNASTNCIFLKSVCNEEGQVVYGHGNRNTDTTCRCDYRRGFDFLVKPNNQCFCKPLQEDCSCYFKTCSNTSQVLSHDYQCIYITDTNLVTQCRPITDEEDISKGKSKLVEHNVSSPVYFIDESHVKITLYEGESFELEYPVSRGNRHVVIYKSGISIKKHNKLLIKHVNIQDEGVYHAEWYLLRSKYTMLTVLPLEIKSPEHELYLIEGETLALNYQLQHERLLLHFFKNNNFIAQTEDITKERNGMLNVLTIRNVKPKDEGLYFAKVNTIRSEATKLTVQSMFTSALEPVYCIEGDILQLKCTVYSEKIDVHWYKGDMEIKENETISINWAESNLNMRKCVILVNTALSLERYRNNSE
ncbi:TTN [Mytilus coruscus]|uniref:TTN n=1 Tax=Mytilus coruscus TaxID=42192 RepID=A0A6J8DPS4_MYTCO|nr:TTN [Mytilus coruscus]